MAFSATSQAVVDRYGPNGGYLVGPQGLVNIPKGGIGIVSTVCADRSSWRRGHRQYFYITLKKKKKMNYCLNLTVTRQVECM